MPYHRYNKLAELLNGDLTAKIRRGILSQDLMDRECNCSLPSKVRICDNKDYKLHIRINQIKYKIVIVVEYTIA